LVATLFSLTFAGKWRPALKKDPLDVTEFFVLKKRGHCRFQRFHARFISINEGMA
jgi:hypothetical protein